MRDTDCRTAADGTIRSYDEYLQRYQPDRWALLQRETPLERAEREYEEALARLRHEQAKAEGRMWR